EYNGLVAAGVADGCDVGFLKGHGRRRLCGERYQSQGRVNRARRPAASARRPPRFVFGFWWSVTAVWTAWSGIRARRPRLRLSTSDAKRRRLRLAQAMHRVRVVVGVSDAAALRIDETNR